MNQLAQDGRLDRRPAASASRQMPASAHRAGPRAAAAPALPADSAGVRRAWRRYLAAIHEIDAGGGKGGFHKAQAANHLDLDAEAGAAPAGAAWSPRRPTGGPARHRPRRLLVTGSQGAPRRRRRHRKFGMGLVEVVATLHLAGGRQCLPQGGDARMPLGAEDERCAVVSACQAPSVRSSNAPGPRPTIVKVGLVVTIAFLDS